MPDLRFLLAALALAACTELPSEDEGGTIGYDQPADIAPSLEPAAGMHDLTDRSDLARFTGRYGVSAADCDPGNRYMTEYIEITDIGFAYRGNLHTLAEIIDPRRFRFSGPDGAREILRFAGGDLVRWPDDRRKRTIYQRCS
ncbi:hypothetical protein [Sphingomicrobium aestuariivivum]|uniref:hypothetical protein n=1 Tax=Sphingomicrobium aestuariivivum TaxID=1582356 RepID=UPI001FD6B3BC|nr:hypothetical protein [Sphingomicrobium aestuariivivum]MCJ8191699.1 hypothetical protein [Sphingomicrobium aestuariivivum]